MFGFGEKTTSPDLEERLRKVERELERIEDSFKRQVRDLDADMDTLWDKVKAWTGRISKRVAAAGATDGMSTTSSAPDAPASAPAKDWNQIIQERRRGIPTRNG